MRSAVRTRSIARAILVSSSTIRTLSDAWWPPRRRAATAVRWFLCELSCGHRAWQGPAATLRAATPASETPHDQVHRHHRRRHQRGHRAHRRPRGGRVRPTSRRGGPRRAGGAGGAADGASPTAAPTLEPEIVYVKPAPAPKTVVVERQTATRNARGEPQQRPDSPGPCRCVRTTIAMSERTTRRGPRTGRRLMVEPAVGDTGPSAPRPRASHAQQAEPAAGPADGRRRRAGGTLRHRGWHRPAARRQRGERIEQRWPRPGRDELAAAAPLARLVSSAPSATCASSRARRRPLARRSSARRRRRRVSWCTG